MTLFRFVFKRFFRNKSNFIFLLILPVASAFLPRAEWTPLPLGYQYYGMLILFIAARLAGVMLEDRENRIFLRLGAAPITHFQYLWQNVAAYSLIMTAVNLAMVLTGVLVHGDMLPSPALLFILYSTFTLTALGFALTWHSLFRNKEVSFSILSGVIIMMAMLGGLFWPVEAMPGLLGRLAMLLPTYWLADGLKHIAAGAPNLDLAVPVIMLLLFCTAFLIIGSRRRIA